MTEEARLTRAQQDREAGPSSTRWRGGQRLDPRVEGLMESRFGHDFSAVRVHDDRQAATNADGLRASAFTSGNDIFFASGRYAPATGAGEALLEHELAHVVQQRSGAVAPGLGRANDPLETAAARGAAGLHPVRSNSRPSFQQAASIQRQSVGGGTPDWLIPVADLIRLVETIEAALPTAPPEEILTRIRQEYYAGPGFDELIPDAPYRRLAPAYAQPPAGGASPLYYTNRLGTDLPSGGTTGDAVRRLTTHAYENRRPGESAIGDNPSPYFAMPDGSRIDLGHLLLALDSLIHPTVANPYSAYGIPGIDPAGLAADLALASYWTSYHERTGTRAANAPQNSPATADFDAYYRASAPDEDLLGDIDAFSAKNQWSAGSGQRVSQVLRATYLGVGGGRPRIDQRYRAFASANNLTYSRTGTSITWDAAAIEAAWGPRINRMCDLFNAGTGSLISSKFLGTAPTAGATSWPYSLPALRRFLAWLKPRLEAEIAANP